MSALQGWTLVKPPKFTEGPAVAAAKIGPAANIGVGSKISRATLAKVLLGEVQAPQFAQQSVYAAEG
jgi:hypothetical protein